MTDIAKAIAAMVTADSLREHKSTHDKSNSWWLNDSQGIPLSRVCEDCERLVRAGYAPHVFGSNADYDEAVEGAGERIDEDYQPGERFAIAWLVMDGRVHEWLDVSIPPEVWH